MLLQQIHREPVVYPNEFPWAAVGRVVATFPDKRTEQGSGALIGSRFAATAARALVREEHGGRAASVTFTQGGRAMKVAASNLFIAGELAMLELPEDVDDHLAPVAFACEQLRSLGASWLTGYPRDRGGAEMWTEETTLSGFDDRHLFTIATGDIGAVLTTEIDYEIVLLGISLGGHVCARISEEALAQYRKWMR